ncbi:MAG: hypothetical protein JXR48_10135 [Candidatus Delongbacteria bacterium]|nr:hypothetical protein [Candidatus Delongbacteria bacterium]MBN2835313.1 hypothetical protein [Candidatus Delongbacteria bacterium]
MPKRYLLQQMSQMVTNRKFNYHDNLVILQIMVQMFQMSDTFEVSDIEDFVDV